ncbi:hypothetical protein HanRHA438_Chr15g0719181 [Helianthus annuus]|nr:hypothetical protein HanRHA438_Chr15g0719181 [Helianthus annuus]
MAEERTGTRLYHLFAARPLTVDDGQEGSQAAASNATESGTTQNEPRAGADVIGAQGTQVLKKSEKEKKKKKKKKK